MTPERILVKLREKASHYTKDDALDEMQLMLWLNEYGVFDDAENHSEVDYFFLRYFPRVLGIEYIAATRIVRVDAIDYGYKDGIGLLSDQFKKHEIFAMALTCALLGIDFAYASMMLNHLSMEELIEGWQNHDDFEDWFTEVTDIDIELAKGFIGHYPNKDLPHFI